MSYSRLFRRMALVLLAGCAWIWITDPAPRSSHIMPPLAMTVERARPLLDLAARLRPEDNLLDIWNNLRTPPAVCFAPGTPPDVMADVNQHMVIDPGPLAYFLGPRWPGAQGSGQALTWSFVPDGLFIGQGITNDNPGPSELFSRLDALFGSRVLWIAKVQQCFDRWQALTGNTYTHITFGGNDWDDGAGWGSNGSADRGDVRISMRNIDGANGVLAFNFFPSSGDMVLDRSEPWGSSTNDYRFFRNVVMHEHGHGVGLQHVCSSDTSQLMEPFLSTSFDGPQHDDLRGGQRHYGDPFEGDNNAATATDVGPVAIGSPITVGIIPAPAIPTSGLLSIDADQEQDWFSFNVNSPRSATVSVIPQGRTYDSSTQNPDSSCSSGNSINSLAFFNLNVEIVESDGTSVLATGNSQPAGATETLADVFLPAAGTYYVRVFESSSFISETQLYTLTIAAETQLPCQGVLCDDGKFCNGAEFCDAGACFDGAPPCSAGQGCDEAMETCFNLPGACCLPEGDCELRASPQCHSGIGHYYGNGSTCTEPLNPPCLPVDAIMTCRPAVTEAFAGDTIPVEIFLQEVDNVGGYQATLMVTRTSGAGSLTVNCPSGARINRKICVLSSTLQPTGNVCDPPTTCPSGQTCVDRPDYIFSGMSTVGAPACQFLEFADVAILNFGDPGVNVGTTPAYLGDANFVISANATPNTTFEIALVNDPTRSFLTQPTGEGIPFRIGPPRIITVLDPAACNTPTVSSGGSRYLEIVPAPSPNAVAFEIQGNLNDPSIACVSQFVQADGTLGNNPIFLTVAQWGAIHARGEDIIPSSKVAGTVIPTTYSVRAYCNPDFSNPAAASTRLWADVDDNTFVNFADIQLIVLAFLGNFVNTTIDEVDLHGCVPNRVINFSDIQLSVQAFQGQSYAGTGCPIPCP